MVSNGNDRQQPLDRIRDVLKQTSSDELKKRVLDGFHDYELAETLVRLDPALQEEFLRIYPPNALADVFSEMNPDDVAELFLTMNITVTSEILNAMQTDDLVDILEAFDERDERIRFLSMVHHQKRNEIKQIIDFPDDVAGSIMNDAFVTLDPNDTVKEAIRHVVGVAPDTEFIDNLYVIEQNRLAGVVSLRELIAAGNEPKVEIHEIMTDNVVSLRPTDRVEEVIEIMRKYDFMLLPVVDDDFRLIGIIAYDDVMEAISSESDIDYSYLAGLADVQEPIDRETVRSNLRKRIPWLVILLFINLITGTIIAGYEATLKLIPVLAVFMPLVLGMAGNSGTQSLGTVIKLFALNRFKTPKDKWIHVLKELFVGFMNGIVIGAVMAVIVLFFRFSGGSSLREAWPLALTISLSVTFALIISTTAGTVIPLGIDLLKIDPAVASGPFMTTVIDIFSLLVYFGFASVFLHQLI